MAVGNPTLQRALAERRAALGMSQPDPEAGTSTDPNPSANYFDDHDRRFYGESTPFGKKSHKTTEILGYLNSQQALADCAILIRSLKQNLSSEASPVVVFGGSYGETWFRLKYPHIAIGALASSAPILQFDNIVPLTSFYDAISQDFKVLYALFAKVMLQ
ncbi:hypothetical protein YC2023_116136 [Brassica napus]